MAALESEFEGLADKLVPLCNLSAASRAQILNQGEVLEFRPGSVVFSQGDEDPYAFYLLDGRLELISGDETVRRLRGSDDDAIHALAQLQPRQMTARAETAVMVLRLDRELLNKLKLADAEDGEAFEVEEIDDGHTDDWMTRMLQSRLFSKLPASNIHRIFSTLESIDVSADTVVVEQDQQGDYYYVIVHGRAEVSRAASPGAPGYRLATIGPGDAFGEEALVGNGIRNATVRMLTNGQVVRLPRAEFVELIKTPLLSPLDHDAAQALVGSGRARWLDVRFPEEFSAGAIDGSINHPLNTLRMHSGRLDADTTWVVYCDDGSRSAVAAFLLAERGFDVHYLEGGFAAGAPAAATSVPATAGAAADDDVAATAPPDLTLHDDETSNGLPDLPAAAPVPASHMSEFDRDPAVKAAVLSVGIAATEQAAEAAERRTGEAAGDSSPDQAAAMAAAVEAARRAAQEEAERRIAEEREHLKAELAAARADAEAAAEARMREERARAAAEQERKLAEERRRVEQESKAAKQEAEQARRIKQQLEKARAMAEAEVAREREAQANRVDQVRAEMERRLREEERKLKESYAWQAEELKRLQEQKRTAEARLKEEQARVAEQSREARTRLQQAREWQERLQQVQAASASEAARKEQEKLALEQRLREELKNKVRSERARLEQELANNAAELRRAVQEREAAEAARQAAAEEAQQIIADFKAAHDRKRMQEEAEMRVERERLETEARQLRTALELAQREKESALAHQRDIEREIAAADDDADVSSETMDALLAEAEAAREEVAKIEQQRVDAQAAAIASEGDLAAHRVHEEHMRDALHEELEGWLKEQSDLENSDAQRQILANQKAHMERIKARAELARSATKEHDLALIAELAQQFGRDDD